MKATAWAPANIAFIKYWGQKDKTIFLPYTNTISMTLSNCFTVTSVEIMEKSIDDDVRVKFFGKEFQRVKNEGDIKQRLMFEHIGRIRALGNDLRFANIRSENNFPSDVGIASSASGFAALTLALCQAYGLDEYVNDRKRLSELIRLGGSVSAMRSSHGGFVESCMDYCRNTCHSEQIATHEHWDLADIVAVVAVDKKKVSSSDGHRAAETSPHFPSRISAIPDRLRRCREAIEKKDIRALGTVIEEDSVCMHCIAMTQKPPIFYWNDSTMRVLDRVRELREKGILAYATIDAGSNVHVICEGDCVLNVKNELASVPGVITLIENKPAEGAKIVLEAVNE